MEPNVIHNWESQTEKGCQSVWPADNLRVGDGETISGWCRAIRWLPAGHWNNIGDVTAGEERLVGFQSRWNDSTIVEKNITILFCGSTKRRISFCHPPGVNRSLMRHCFSLACNLHFISPVFPPLIWTDRRAWPDCWHSVLVTRKRSPCTERSVECTPRATIQWTFPVLLGSNSGIVNQTIRFVDPLLPRSIKAASEAVNLYTRLFFVVFLFILLVGVWWKWSRDAVSCKIYQLKW